MRGFRSAPPWRQASSQKRCAARDSERMTLFLVNGVMLQGTVTGFDQFSLILERGAQLQLVYKHAISTLQPAHALNLGPDHSGDTETES